MTPPPVVTATADTNAMTRFRTLMRGRAFAPRPTATAASLGKPTGRHQARAVRWRWDSGAAPSSLLIRAARSWRTRSEVGFGNPSRKCEIAGSTYEEPFASLLGSHKGSMVDLGGCYSNPLPSLARLLQSLLLDLAQSDKSQPTVRA